MDANKDDMMKRLEKAAIRYLKMIGHTIVDEDSIVSIDNEANQLVMTCVINGFVEPKPNCFMPYLEKEMTDWLSRHPDECREMAVRFDLIFFNVLNENRALLKHVINYGGQR